MASDTSRRGDLTGFCWTSALFVWGWRTEAALALIAQLLGQVSYAALGSGGEVLAFGGIAIAAWRFPVTRRRLAVVLTFAAYSRWWARVARACGIENRFGFRPSLRAVRRVPAGEVLRVALPAGMNFTHLEKSADTLAAAIAVREVRIAKSPEDSSLVDILVVRVDPLAGLLGSWPGSRTRASSLWEPVAIGVDEFGGKVSVSLPEHNLLLGGEPGAGKSNVLSLLVASAALDPTVSLTLLDAKQVELACWRGSANYFVGPDLKHGRFVLGELQQELDRRYESLLATHLRKVARGGDLGLGLHVVVIDELAFFLHGKASKERAELAELLRDLVSRGRAAGFIVIAATQKPSHDVIPTSIRDLFSYRLALRCTTAEASDTVLGAGWATRGYSAASIDPVTRGVGYLLAEGGLPTRMRAYHLEDRDLAALAKKAEVLRSTAMKGESR